jgi:hypothetical protein
MGGDYFLGQLLTLIDPEDVLFDTLPPHWKDEFHPSVRRGIEITFGKVLSCHEHTDHNPLGLLSFLLASILHHSDWLFQEMGKHPGHLFYSIPVLNDPVLLRELKEQLTMEKTDTVPSAMGIPPHVSHAKAITKVFNICMSNKDALDDFKAELKIAVAEETETCFRFLYSRVCLWSIVVNSANIDPAKIRRANPAAGRFARGQKTTISTLP